MPRRRSTKNTNNSSAQLAGPSTSQATYRMSKPGSSKRAAVDNENESDLEPASSFDGIEHDAEDHPEYDTDDDDEQNADAPRVVLWDGEPESDRDIMPGDHDGEWPAEEKILSDISSLPMGALLKARRALARAQAEPEQELSAGSETHDEALESDEESPEELRKDGSRAEWSAKPKRELQKRSNKHAPMEATSKRPVSRRRVVVDVKKPQARDPRFSPLSGELSSRSFRSQYSFLTEMHQSELSTLKESLKRARKSIKSSPRDLQQERAEEVQRLELAVKRAESTVNRDRRDQVESAALEKVAKDEREKRKGGKSNWFMKDSEKKDLLLRARFEDLAASGGKSAVRKAIEKKQTKQAQKEKKSRPYGPQRGNNQEHSNERPFGKQSRHSPGANGAKRRKLG